MTKATRISIQTEKAPLPPPFLSQGIKVGDMVYCSGQIGVDPTTGKMVEGPIQARTVYPPPPPPHYLSTMLDM
jgi:2-iminobutanoate/2-iminopropanoate deaminase